MRARTPTWVEGDVVVGRFRKLTLGSYRPLLERRLARKRVRLELDGLRNES